MKIKDVRIKNFRSFKDEVVAFDDYNCMVGPNGAGKSTVMNALNVFFRQYKDSKTDLSKLSEDDFHHKNTAMPIEITVTFKDLSEEAKADLSDYVRQDSLIVTAKAEYDDGTGNAEVKQYGNRLGITEFRKWFEAEKDKCSVADLKSVYTSIQGVFPILRSASTKADMRNALIEYESMNPNLCSLIPSEDQFYGVSKGVNKLSSHLQWVFVSASKDFSEEAEESKNSALGQLLSRAIRSKVDFSTKVSQIREEVKLSYQKMLEDEQGILQEISNSIEDRLKHWANPSATAKLLWKNDANKSIKVEEPLAYMQIGEKGFESELSRFGHGMQRSYLLTMLQELASIDDGNMPTLVLAVEEPELYQHPPQAKYLSEILQELSKENTQVVICTHSPYFIPGDDFHTVRLVKECGDPLATKVTSLDYALLVKSLNDAGEKQIKESGMIAKLYPVLRPEISEMFFCKNLILVEGIEDVAYLTTYIHLMDRMSEFRRSGYHILPVGGKSELIKPIAIAKLLDINVFVVCDADTNKDRECEVVKHKKDNAAILTLLGHDPQENWPDEDISKSNLKMWKTNITDTIAPSLGDGWKTYEEKAAAFYGNAGGMKKNPLAISRALENAWNSSVKSDKLIKLIEDIFK